MEFAPPVLVGVRSMCTQEHDFLSQADVPLFTAKEFLDDERSLDRIVHALSRHVYLSLDLDVFDPSQMPSVGTPEPGGLNWHDVLRILRRVATQKKIIAADFVELSPIPGLVAPDFLAAKLVYTTVGYVLFPHKLEKNTPSA